MRELKEDGYGESRQRHELPDIRGMRTGVACVCVCSGNGVLGVHVDSGDASDKV